jgi:hypothetical protein
MSFTLAKSVMLKHFYLSLSLAVLTCFQVLKAQQQGKSDTATARNVVLVGGIQYISNITYAGRRDASSAPTGIPTMTLISKKGFFLGTSAYMNLVRDRLSADGFSLTPGYIFPIDASQKLKLTISGTKYFFKKTSNIILSTFKGSADVGLSYQPDFLNFAINNSYQFGKETNDILNSLDVSKEIGLSEFISLPLKIEPTISAYAGTQSFTETYYTETINRLPGGGLLGLLPGQTQPGTQEQSRESKKYQALSLTANLPVSLTVSRFQLTLTPYLILPLNEVEYVNNKHGNYFLYTAGITYRFL